MGYLCSGNFEIVSSKIGKNYTGAAKKLQARKR
jgi:hypothetical protein